MRAITFLRPHHNGGLHMKLCTPKVAKVPIARISGLPLGSPGTKSHLDVAPVERRKV
jgi:hypothetical protein